MAKKRVAVKVNPSPSEDTASLDIEWGVNGDLREPPPPLGPEGSPKLILGTIDLPENGTVNVGVKVTAVDRAGNRSVAAESNRTFTGVDTTDPDSPAAPEILDLEDEEAT